MSSGHGYKKKSTFPLTAAMTDGKPQQSHVEEATPGASTSAGTPAGGYTPGSRDRSFDDGTLYNEKHTGGATDANNLQRRRSSHKPDLVANTNARLANPLGDLTEDEVVKQAGDFAEANGLPVDVFRKGGLLAKSPHKWSTMPQLTDEERTACEREITHKYDQPWTLYNLVIACSVAAAVQGMDESVISGAQLFYPKQFGIDPKDAVDAGRNQWLQGLVNGAPYLCCGVIGCWLTDPLNRFFGRRGTIIITCFISFATCIWGACTNTWWHLLISRFFLGFGIGPKSATVPIFSAECTPASIRGSLVMQWQMWTAFGIMLGYAADLAFYHVPVHKPGITGLNWRLMLGSAGFPALIVMAQMPFLPESPRWLMRHGRYQKAYEAMNRLRKNPVLAARDIYYIFVLLEEEAAIVRSRSRVWEMFSIGRNRRAMFASQIVMFGQQFCGVNAIVYYTATIFTEAGFGEIEALLASWGFGMVNCIFALPAVFTIDRFGRRPLLLLTFPVMSLMLLFTGFCFWIPAESRARIGLVATGIYVYTAFYSSGEGPVPFTYSAEVYPLYIRELGMSLATATTWLFNFIVSLTFPRLLTAFKPQGAFGWYSAWCAILWVLVLFFLPESKGLTLEELDQVFSVPTGVHAKYQLYNIKYYFRKYILRKREPHRQLYHFDNDSDEDLNEKSLGKANGRSNGKTSAEYGGGAMHREEAAPGVPGAGNTAADTRTHYNGDVAPASVDNTTRV